jgi:hypothetical protein
MSQIALLAAAFAGASACTSRHDSSDLPSPEPRPAESFAAVAEQCAMVTSIEVVHRVNGSPVTDRVRLTDEVGADAAMALRSFQVAANYFGAANIISSRPISQVQCFPQTSAVTGPIVKLSDPPLGLCADANGVIDCTLPQPSHTYDYTGTESCSFTNYTEATSVSCTDSSAIVTRHGDVVLTVNTANLRNEMLARTQALRALVGDANVVTNFHFDIVVTPDQQASIVGNEAYATIAQQIKQASENGQPLPDIQQILHNLPQPPTNVQFYRELLRAYQIKLDRLSLLAQVTNGELLSSQQVNAFFQLFVNKSRLVDQLNVDHSASALNQAAGILNDTITQLATTDRSSTIYNQVKSGAQSMLEAHTSNGVFDPDHKIDFVVPNLYQSLTDADLEKRLVSSDMLNDLNQQLQRSDGRRRAHDMTGPLKMMQPALQSGDMDTVWRLYDQVKATEFFFDHTDPAGTSYDVHLTPAAQAMFNITVLPTSAKSVEVINIINETADFNAATGKVTVDYYANISINLRSALSTDDSYRALYHTEESWGTLSFLKNAGGAVLAGALVELGLEAAGIIDVVGAGWTGVDAIAAHLKAGLANWHQTMDAVLQEGLDTLRRWPNMPPEEGAELVARVAGKILQTIPPEVIASGRFQEAMEAGVRLYCDQASRGLALIEHSGVHLSPDAAVELVKQLDGVGITDIDESIEIADALDDAMPCNMVGTVVGSLNAAASTLTAAEKPNCNDKQIAERFQGFKAQAGKMGVTDPREVKDLMESSEAIGHPGRIDPGKLDDVELPFAQKLIERDGGVLVGPVRKGREAIDGFYAGHPMQLKSLTTDKLRNILDYVGQAEAKVIKFKFSGVDLYIRCEAVTRNALLAEIQLDGLASITLEGRLSSMHFLTAGGWIDIVGGVIR